MGARPLKPTYEAFLESDQVFKLEFLAEPNIFTDFSFNQQMEVFVNFIRRLMKGVVGTVRVSGFDVHYTGGNVVIDPGLILHESFIVNKSGSTSNALIASSCVVYMTITTHVYDFEDYPNEVGVLIPSSGRRLSGPNQYRYALAYTYAAGSVPSSSVAGTMTSENVFTPSASTWVDSAEVKKVAQLKDASGDIIAEHQVVTTTTTTLTFDSGVKLSGSGIASIELAQYVKLADVTAVGVVTESIPELDGKTVAQNLHSQNTDTGTNQSNFYIDTGGENKAAVKISDTPVTPVNISVESGTLGRDASGLWLPGYSLAHRSIDTFTSWARIKWGYTGSGTGAVNSFTDTDAEWTVNEVQNHALIDSAGIRFTISSNTSTVLTVSGTPASGDYTITPNAHLYQMRVYPWGHSVVQEDWEEEVLWFVTYSLNPHQTLSRYITGLPGNRRYRIQIRSVNLYGSGNFGFQFSDWTIAFDFRTGYSTQPSTVLPTVAPSNYGVVVSWAPVDYAAFYELTWTLDGTTPSFSEPQQGYFKRVYGTKYQIYADPGARVRIGFWVVSPSGYLSLPRHVEGQAGGTVSRDNIRVINFSFRHWAAKSLTQNGSGSGYLNVTDNLAPGQYANCGAILETDAGKYSVMGNDVNKIYLTRSSIDPGTANPVIGHIGSSSDPTHARQIAIFALPYGVEFVKLEAFILQAYYDSATPALAKIRLYRSNNESDALVLAFSIDNLGARRRFYEQSGEGFSYPAGATWVLDSWDGVSSAITLHADIRLHYREPSPEVLLGDTNLIPASSQGVSS